MPYVTIDEQGRAWWMNPPTYQDGDECQCPDTDKWMQCMVGEGCRNQRRRLILPGTNAVGQEMEICGVDEVLPRTEGKFDQPFHWFNGKEWNVFQGLSSNERTVGDLVKAYPSIIAIRRPKKQEQWPRYWLSKSDTLWRQDSETDTGSCLNKEGVFEKYIPKMQQLIECVRLLGLKPITPAEAQAIMDQNQPELIAPLPQADDEGEFEAWALDYQKRYVNKETNLLNAGDAVKDFIKWQSNRGGGK